MESIVASLCASRSTGTTQAVALRCFPKASVGPFNWEKSISSTDNSITFPCQFNPSPHPQVVNPFFIPPSQLLIRHAPHLRPHLFHAHLRVHEHHPFPFATANLLGVPRRPLQTRINKHPSQPFPSM